MKTKQVYGISEPVTALTLHFGRWKELFNDDRRKIIFAEALNYCIEADKTKTTRLIGYQISDAQAQVIFKMSRHRVKQALYLLKEELEREIRLEIARLKTLRMTEHQKERLMVIDLGPGKLFDESDLRNDLLIRVLTGQTVNLPYSDPTLKRLKDETTRNRFCSVVDYSGAIGPVQITTIKTKSTDQ